MDRTFKASTVEEEGKKFVGLWREVQGKTGHLYLHLLTKHLPDQIRDMPVDPYYLQLQSLESRHGIRKKWAFQTNKHAPKAIEERIASVQTYIRNNKAVRGHSRSTGKCRAFQTLALSLLDNVLRSVFENQQSIRFKYERYEERKKRRNQAVARAKLPLWEKLTAEAAKLTLAEEVAKELTDQKTRRALQAKRSQRQNPLPHQKIKTVRARHDF